MKSLWIRAETLAHERRSALSPADANRLIQKGYAIYVERSAQRIFTDKEYAEQGCFLVEPGSHPNASSDDFILGIKSLPNSDIPINQQHIYFAHAYKGQLGADKILTRFKQGRGAIFDLEYLYDEKRRRACYFGYWSGVAAACLSLLHWINQQLPSPEEIPSHFDSLDPCLTLIEQRLKKIGRRPNALIIGHLGNCGKGVAALCEHFGLNTTAWDINETRNRNYFAEIFVHNIFFNCINLTDAIHPFITKEQLTQFNSQIPLSLICDIACDIENPNNPLPVYTQTTTLEQPAQTITNINQPVDIIAIPNMPSFFPRESSIAFSEQLLPYIDELLSSQQLPTAWQQLKQMYTSCIHSLH